MTDKEKIERLWDVVTELVDHIAVGLNVSGQLDEFLEMGMSKELLLAIGYDEEEISAKLAEMDQ